MVLFSANLFCFIIWAPYLGLGLVATHGEKPEALAAIRYLSAAQRKVCSVIIKEIIWTVEPYWAEDPRCSCANLENQFLLASPSATSGH